ncbi:MAG: hypothetical protein CTY20_00235 [Hyphomicrobium sp.]|nr:MAG: hypothetical protein CTY20_00235 [Hyphomicrobium sp.]
MRGLNGLTFVLAGGAAVLYGYFPTQTEREQAYRDISALAAPAASHGAQSQGPSNSTSSGALVVIDPQRRIFSPQAPLFQAPPTEPATTAGTLPSPTGITAGNDARQAPARSASEGRPPSLSVPLISPDAPTRPTQTATVSTDARPTQKALDANNSFAVRPLTSPKAGDDDARRELTNKLQKELKRVGCYDGDISGSWNAATRRAMKSFTDRVNATLPVEDPDYILLTLVQGHASQACGTKCPADQGLGADGRCIPNAIIAQAARKAARAETAKTDRVKRSADPVATDQPGATIGISDARKTELAKSETARPSRKKSEQTVAANAGLVEHPGVAGATTKTDRQPEKSSAAPGTWHTTTTAAAQAAPIAVATTTVTKSAATAEARAGAVQSPEQPVEPLPGRMAVGGPVAVAGGASIVSAAASTASPVNEAPASGPVNSAARVPGARYGTDNGGTDNGDGSSSVSNLNSSTVPAAVPKRAAARLSAPRPQRNVPPYYVGAVYAPKPARPPKSARIRLSPYEVFHNPLRAIN